MAKGFTVKAKTPKKSEKAPEWDYDKAKEIMRGKTVVSVSYTHLTLPTSDLV